MYPSSEILINKLWDDFQVFIKGNWTIPIEVGTKDGKVKKRILADDFGHYQDLNQVQPQIKFCQILCQILKHSLAQKGKEGFKVPHENTMRNFLKSGLSASTQKNTLNAFAVFLGYDHWTDFRRKNAQHTYALPQPKEKSSTEEKEETTVQVIPVMVKSAQIPAQPERFRLTRKREKMKPWRFAAVGAFMFLLAVIVQYYYQPDNNRMYESEVKNVISVVKNANKAEFAAYCNVPRVDTVALDSFFINSRPEGSARAAIVGTLKRAKRSGRVLVEPASSYNLIHVEVKEIQDTIAFVATTEKWHLRWFDTIQNKEVLIYDTTNSHNYILVKKGKRWKILMDDYDGKFRRPDNMVSAIFIYNKFFTPLLKKYH